MRASYVHFTGPFVLAMLLAAASPPPVAANNAVHPDAAAALDKLNSVFREHDILVLTANITAEYDLNAYEKIVDEGTVRISARQPDRFRISENMRILDREIYDDGKTVTVHPLRPGPRTSFPAAPTIAGTFAMAAEVHGVQLPLVELIVWASDRSLPESLTSGIPAGSEDVGGRRCDRYVFRTETIDWQLWIAAEAPALPCKLVVSRGSGETKRPSRTTALLAWSFPESLEDDVFIAPPEQEWNVVLSPVPASPRANRVARAASVRTPPPACRPPYALAGASCRARR